MNSPPHAHLDASSRNLVTTRWCCSGKSSLKATDCGTTDRLFCVERPRLSLGVTLRIDDTWPTDRPRHERIITVLRCQPPSSSHVAQKMRGLLAGTGSPPTEVPNRLEAQNALGISLSMGHGLDRSDPSNHEDRSYILIASYLILTILSEFT